MVVLSGGRSLRTSPGGRNSRARPPYIVAQIFTAHSGGSDLTSRLEMPPRNKCRTNFLDNRKTRGALALSQGRKCDDFLTTKCSESATSTAHSIYGPYGFIGDIPGGFPMGGHWTPEREKIQINCPRLFRYLLIRWCLVVLIGVGIDRDR